MWNCSAGPLVDNSKFVGGNMLVNPCVRFLNRTMLIRSRLRSASIVEAGMLGILGAGLGHASVQGLDGSVLLRTCQAAAQVKALSVICQTYINGFLDTAAYYQNSSGKPHPTFCLAEQDKERIPTVVVVWLNAHPDYLKQPAPAALHAALSENFPCKSGTRKTK
jgi:hypothetical protein